MAAILCAVGGTLTRWVDNATAQEASGEETTAGPPTADEWWEKARRLTQWAQFEEAAAAYEACAAASEDDGESGDRAADALLYAIDIRIGVGDIDSATADARTLHERFGSNRRYEQLAAEAFFKAGELFHSTENRPKVVEHYGRYLSEWAERGQRDLHVRAVMLVAEAHWSLSQCGEDAGRRERRTCADEREAAFDYAARANGMVRLPDFGFGTDEGEETYNADPAAILAGRREQTWRRLLEQLALEVDAEGDAATALIAVRADKVANAIGQARFYIGERIHEQFEALAWPEFDPADWEYRGNACDQFLGADEYLRMCVSMEKYRQWTEKAFVPFAQKRDEKIKEARAFYDSIANLQVPIWEIAAAGRVGDMFLRFWKDLTGAPTPPAFRTEASGGIGGVGQIYREQLLEQADPIREHALEAYGYCLATAIREQWFNEHSDRCLARLQELEPEGYPEPYEAYAPVGLDVRHFAAPDVDEILQAAAAIDGADAVPTEEVPGDLVIDENGRTRFYPSPPPPPAAR